MKELAVIRARQLVTLAGPARPRTGLELRELAIIENGGVLVQDGLITAVGPSREVESLASPYAARVDATGCVVIPGFVDAHTHPVFAGTREDEYEMRALGATYQEIAAHGGGILSTVRKTRAASEDELFDLAVPRIKWMLAHGTTTIEAKSGYGLTLEDELKILRVIRRLNDETPMDVVPTFLGAHEAPEEFRGSPDGRSEYLRIVIEEMLPAVAEERLARYCDVFCESHVFTVDESRTVLRRASELGMKARIHADQLSLSGGAQLAVELGAATADHLEWVDEAGISAIAASGVVAVLLPGAVFNLGLRRYPPARALIEAGARVALATDFNPGSSPTPSMQMVLSIACTQMGMTPAEALTAATINAAFTVNRADKIGTLEVGRRADLVVCDCSDYRQIPYFFGVNHARTVVKSGSVVVGEPEPPR